LKRGDAAAAAPRGRACATKERLLYTAPPAPDEALMSELRRRFKPEVVALSEYLGGIW
jgi:hypothetical protein